MSDSHEYENDIMEEEMIFEELGSPYKISRIMSHK